MLQPCCHTSDREGWDGGYQETQGGAASRLYWFDAGREEGGRQWGVGGGEPCTQADDSLK